MKSRNLRFLFDFLYVSCFACIVLGCTEEFLNNLKPGVRVKRGPHWKWGNQDGGVGSLGTVTERKTSNGWVSVKWTNGHTNLYRVGFEKNCDLDIVGHNSTECTILPQNDTIDTALIFPSDTISFTSNIFYYCQRKLISTSSDQIISFTLLWYNEDSCNITIYEGSGNKGEIYGSICQNKIGTYHSRNNSLFVEFSLKNETERAGFLASFHSEEPECKESYNKFIKGGESGYIQPPYSNITLITPLKCQWTLTTDHSHVFQINLVKFEELKYLDIYDGNTQIEHLNRKTFHYKTKLPTLDVFYNKPSIYSSGFVISYKSIPKEKLFCPDIKSRDYGTRFQFPISTVFKNDSMLKKACQFFIHSDESTYVELDFQRIDNSSCNPKFLEMKINNRIYPLETGGSIQQFSMRAKKFHIEYLLITRCSKFSILVYVKRVPIPSCFRNSTVEVTSGSTRFINVPQLIPYDNVGECKWTFNIKPKHILNLEIITTYKKAWPTYKCFSYLNGTSWQRLQNSKIYTSGLTFQLKYKKQHEFMKMSEDIIISYTSVIQEEKTETTTEQSTRITTAKPWGAKITTTKPWGVKITTTKPWEISNMSAISLCKDKIITETTIPPWIYSIFALLILICIVLACVCWILNRRRMYVNNESFIYNKSLLKHENIEI